jgi:putative endonuclease
MTNYKKKIGDFGEKLAEQYLVRRGYKIISTKQKISYQEIDIIANIKDIIVFIEVKTRTSDVLGLAEEAMSSAKLKNLKNGIKKYLNNSQNYFKNVRLDLIAININKQRKTAKIKHYKDIM